MNHSPEPDFAHASEFITHTLQQVEALISTEQAGYVRHYLRYDEYEMAFELLFLAIMDHPAPAGVDFAMALNIGTALRLDVEDGSIYEVDFFKKLSTYAAEALHA